MSYSCFLQKEHPPTSEEVSAALGRCLPLWEELLHFIDVTYQLQGEWSYFGGIYGWSLRFKKSARAVLSAYPSHDGFYSLIILSQPLANSALALPLSEPLKDLISATRQYTEGRWLFIYVDTPETLAEVEELIRLKTPPRLKKAGGRRLS